jgi:hypothetical protein
MIDSRVYINLSFSQYTQNHSLARATRIRKVLFRDGF